MKIQERFGFDFNSSEDRRISLATTFWVDEINWF